MTACGYGYSGYLQFKYNENKPIYLKPRYILLNGASRRFVFLLAFLANSL